jgi:hypothetical protein
MESIPAGMQAGVFNAETNVLETATAWQEVTVPAGARVQRWVVVGNVGYFENFAKTVGRLKAFSFELFPNPAQKAIAIRYTVPQTGVSQLRFDLFSLQGRIVWSYQSEKNPTPGSHVLAWDGASGYAKMPAGMYLLRISATDERGVRRNMGEKRVTYLP